MQLEAFNSNINLYLKTEKNKIKSMQSNEFENYIADLFQKLGYNAILTPPTNDGGKDIVITKNNKTFYVECKHFSEGLVGREIVQKLVGAAVIDGNVDGFIVVTSSYFNSNAIECAEKNNKIVLLDLEDIMSLIESSLSSSTNENSEVIARLNTLNGYNLQVCLNKKDDIISFIEYNSSDKLLNKISISDDEFLKLIDKIKIIPSILKARSTMKADLKVVPKYNHNINFNAIAENEPFNTSYILIESYGTSNFYLCKNHITLMPVDNTFALEFTFATLEKQSDIANLTRVKCNVRNNTMEELFRHTLNIKNNKKSLQHARRNLQKFDTNSVIAHCIHFILSNLKDGKSELVCEVAGRKFFNLLNVQEFD